MKANLTFSKAFTELEKLVEQIEDDRIQLDTLVDKINRAKEYIEFCEKKLRTIEKDVEHSLKQAKARRK